LANVRKTFIVLGLFYSAIFCSLSHGEVLSEQRLKEFSVLTTKKYLFYVSKDEKNFILLGGSWSRKISSNEFYYKSQVDEYKKVEHKKLIDQIKRASKKEYKVYLKKGKKFYSISKGDFVRIYPPELLQIFAKKEKPKQKVKQKSIKEKLRDASQCRYCQIKISGNYVSIDGATQFSPEIGWLPYFKYSERFGLAASLSGSTYLTEDSNLQETISLGLRAQFFGRYYFDRIFLEAGGGFHYFMDYKDISPALAIGGGYLFKRHYWFLTEKVVFSGLYFHASQVSWDKDIIEYKFGIAISL